jgi:hypothetical protein
LKAPEQPSVVSFTYCTLPVKTFSILEGTTVVHPKVERELPFRDSGLASMTRIIISQSIMVQTQETKSPRSSLCNYKREGFPSLKKRGWGRFSQEYVFSITDSLISKE